jgi:hypothetical protein
MLLLIAGVIYIAMTYFKGTKNTDTYSDGFTTRPYDGMDQTTGRPDGQQPRQPWEQGYVDEADGMEDRSDSDGADEAWEDPGDGDVPADAEETDAGTESEAGGDAEAFDAAAAAAARTTTSAAPKGPMAEAAENAADTAAAGEPAAAAFRNPFEDSYHLSDSGVQVDTEVQLDAQMPSDPGTTDSQQ